MTVKENIDLAGTASTGGVRALAGAVAGVDARHAGHLRAAGAIPLGRPGGHSRQADSPRPR